GEDGGVRTNADGKRQHRNQSEARIPPQLAQPIADVLREFIKPAWNPYASRILAGEQHIAQRAAAPRSCLFRTKPGFLELFLLQRAMKLDFFGEFLFNLAAMKPVIETAQQLAHIVLTRFEELCEWHSRAGRTLRVPCGVACGPAR